MYADLEQRVTDADINAVYESIFDIAVESSHVIDKETRNRLPDDCFGIIGTDSDGKPKRSYPLRVPGDKQKTSELCSKAIQMFHYCKPEWKKDLAKSIVRVISSEKLSIQINKRNQMFRYVSESDLPKSVTLVEPAKRTQKGYKFDES